jgi:rRNA processing protein Krr1/Pno1
MEEDENLREEYLEIITNQIENKDPIETRTTYKRLINEGHSSDEAMNLLADCIEIEIIDVIQNGKTFNKMRYVLNLAGLPEEPRM